MWYSLSDTNGISSPKQERTRKKQRKTIGKIMFIKKIIKDPLVAFMSYRKKRLFFSKQKNNYGLSRKDIRKANSLGFTADEYIIYDLKHNDPTKYLSEYERYQFRDAVQNYRILLDNKIVFYSIIRNFAPVNQIFAYKINGGYTALAEGFSEDGIVARIRELGKLVYKDISLGGGTGFRLLEFSDGEYSINRKKSKEEDILSLFQRKNFLIEEFCNQGSFEQRFWPYSVNTVRIVTLIFHEAVQIVAAFQRIGLNREKCVDNACAGGLCATIDLTSGVLSAARSHAPEYFFARDGSPNCFKNHPGTNAQIEGVRIPGWTSLCSEIKELHQKLAFTGIEFIAWDIALLEYRFKIIEANTSCSMDLLQTFEGARNGVIGKWMKEKGYIS